jgi:hypothetical protein
MPLRTSYLYNRLLINICPRSTSSRRHSTFPSYLLCQIQRYNVVVLCLRAKTPFDPRLRGCLAFD